MPSGQNMSFSTTFTARVRETTVENNTSNEYEKAIALKKSNVTAFLIMRNIRKTSADGESKNRCGKISEYHISRCIKITSKWKEVQTQGSMAIQFEKIDLTSSDEKRNSRSPHGKHILPKVSRTKVMTVVIRNWTIESTPHVREIWELCNDSAQKYLQVRKAERAAIASRRKIGMGSTIIDEKTRRRERNRISKDPRLPMSYSRATGARMSQGRKIMAALSKTDHARPRSSYASLSGAAGRKSFAKSLIGSPNLSGVDLKLKPRHQGTRPTNRRIVKALDERLSDAAINGKSVFSSTPTNIQNARVSASPPSCDRGRSAPANVKTARVSVSPPSCDRAKPAPINVKTARVSVPPPSCDEGRSAPVADISNLPNGSPPSSNKKRPVEAPTTQDGQVNRKRGMSEQVKQHLGSSETVVARKRLRPFVRDTIAAAGIANEGNTCYLSAVVQALMSDSVLISSLRKKFLPEMELSFSSALITLENDRDSSTILKAGNIRNAISRHFPEFSSSNQQDAHEFLLGCLDVLTRECTIDNFRDSPTHTLYSLVQERKFTCISCGHSRTPPKEILRGLSLDIPRRTNDPVDQGIALELSVESLLTNFFASQDVDLDCENCSGKKARSDSKVVLAPRVLVLHIKRFGVSYERESGAVTLEKISDAVHIPRRLCLNTLLSDGAIAAHHIQNPPESISASDDPLSRKKMAPCGNPRAFLPGAEVEAIDVLASAPPQNTQVFDQAAKRPSNTTGKNNAASRLGNIDFAQRFRIHATESTGEQQASAEIATHESEHGPEQRVNRKLEFEDDDLEDDIISSPAAPERTISRGPANPEHVRKIAALGLPMQEAKDLLISTNFDLTAAMGLALDRRNEARENPPNLDRDLLRCISTLQQQDSLVQTPAANYRLGAVIRHHSNSMSWGHYVADILQRDGTWYCYDDSTVSEMGDRSIQDSEGYLCWYMMSD